MLQIFEFDVVLESSFELFLILDCPRCFPLEDLEHSDAKGPYVALLRVLFFQQGFWTHVEGTADLIGLFDCGFRTNSEPQVGQFGFILVQQYVLGFYVSVDDSFLVEMADACNYFNDEFESFVEVESSWVRGGVPVCWRRLERSPSAQ